MFSAGALRKLPGLRKFWEASDRMPRAMRMGLIFWQSAPGASCPGQGSGATAGDSARDVPGRMSFSCVSESPGRIGATLSPGWGVPDTMSAIR